MLGGLRINCNEYTSSKMKLVLWSCTGMGNTLVVIKGKIKLVYLDINWNAFPSGKIQLVL